MLEVNKLSRHYGSFVAVDNVSFTIGKREIVGLLGHNGAGKTTIMKMLSGYLEPNQGQITIGGIDLCTDPKQIQQELGYLPENPPLYPEMCVADYLDYAADLKGLANRRKTVEIRRAIDATDLGVKLLDPIATLSRGYKQRVGVAQAILGQPKLLILDEPTNGLDPTQTEHMRQLIRELATEATVILSTHIMQEVSALCERVLILSQGSLAVDAKLEELQQSHHLLLTTSMPEGAAQALPKIEGLEVLQDERNAGSRYRLKVQGIDAVTPASAAIAHAVVHQGYELYGLQPERRDLETLFHEVSNVHVNPNRSSELQQQKDASRHAA